MNSTADQTAADALIADVALSAEERAAVHKHAIRSAIEIGLIGVACWYVVWIVIPNTLPVWTGLPAFAVFGTLWLRLRTADAEVASEGNPDQTRESRSICPIISKSN